MSFTFVQLQYQETGEKKRLFTSFNYQGESWDQSRRIIAKVEYTLLGANQRFVVPTSLTQNLTAVLPGKATPAPPPPAFIVAAYISKKVMKLAFSSRL